MMHDERESADQTETGGDVGKNRRFAFGPGTVIAAVLAVLLLLIASGVLQISDTSSAEPEDTGVTEAVTETQSRTVSDTAFSAPAEASDAAADSEEEAGSAAETEPEEGT